MVEPPKLAICAIVKDEALYIEEWLAFHFLQGVSERPSKGGGKSIISKAARAYVENIG
jgi:hypothetical protein